MEGVVVEVVEDGVSAFEQFEVELGEESVEALVLLDGVIGTDLVFGGGPIAQGFDGDIELGGGAAQVAFECIDEVEGVDFAGEGVAFWHGGLSLAVVGLGSG